MQLNLFNMDTIESDLGIMNKEVFSLNLAVAMCP